MKNGKDMLLKAVDKDVKLQNALAFREGILMAYKDGHKIDVMAKVLGLTPKEIKEIIGEQQQWHNTLSLLDNFHSVLEERREKRKKTKAR